MRYDRSMISALFALLAPADDLDARVKAVLPTSAEERFLAIPWRLDLTEARAEAARTKKPIFLWLMNGHPMGCT